MKLIKFILALSLISCASVDENPTPVKDKELTRMCFIGDTGTGGKDQYKVANMLALEECSAVFITGDVIYEIGIWREDTSALDKKFFNPYNQILNMQNKPIYITLGNHDYYGLEHLWLKVAKKHKNVVFPNYFYKIKSGDLCIFALDTNSKLDEQEDWIEKELKDSSCKKKIAFGHHPYRSSGWHGDASGDIEDFLEDYIIGKVDMYIAGHDHNLEDAGTVNGTRLLVSGAGAKLRDLKKKPGVWGASKLGYVIVKEDLSYEWRIVE